MLTVPGHILQRVRSYGARFFHHFGIHCATHQIRVILISAVVITSLLFPAVHQYLPPHSHGFALTLRALDSFLTPDDISSYFLRQDTRNLWEGHEDIQVLEDSVARVRCGTEGLLRLERVLVHSSATVGPTGALNHDTLLATLELEDRISKVIHSRGLPCLRGPGRSCFSLSPLAYWNHDIHELTNDSDVLHTINAHRNVSVAGVLLRPDMVLAGRDGDEIEEETDSAMFLVLSYFFLDTDCLGNAGHFAWLHALEDAISTNGHLILQARAPDLIALDYKKVTSANKRTSVLSIFSYVAYLAFAVYFYQSMRRMDKVHSRIGLAFTGLVEILVSTITSVSVCTLVGFKVTMVPWEIFPIVVIFIGVENMLTLVDAVVHTSIALPVKMRVAEGLSRAGTSNTLKVVSYNTVLGVIAFFSTGAIRQFCAFAIVVLVAHWFLVHTFFVTVLSIDIQRLELDELLQQGTTLTSPHDDKKDDNTKLPHTKWGRFLLNTQTMVRGRPAKNISLLLLLAVTATLYWAAYPGSADIKNRRHVIHRGGSPAIDTVSLSDSITPAERIWQLLNPAGNDIVHVRMESPAILLLHTRSSDESRDHVAEYQNRSRLSLLFLRLLRPAVWFGKIVVVPMIFTIVALYALLLYLLKDAELLEAQRNRAEPNEPIIKEEITFAALPRAFPTDVETVAANRNGTVVVAIGMQNELVVWKLDDCTCKTLDTSDLLLECTMPSPASMLTSAAVDEEGVFCAAGNGAGIIALWSLAKGSIQPQTVFPDSAASAVTQIHFSQALSLESDESSSMASSALSSTPPYPGTIYAVYENGNVVRWPIQSHIHPIRYTPTRSGVLVKSLLLSVHADDRALVAFIMDDGAVELIDPERPDDLLHPECCIPAGNPADLVCTLHTCKTELEGADRLIIAAVTHAGVISIWDGSTMERICVIEGAFGSVSNLRIVPSPIEICSTCGEYPFENFLLVFSAGQIVVFYRAYLSIPTHRCTCVQNQPKPQLRSSILGRRSRSASGASSTGVVTPTHVRSRVSSISSTAPVETSMYPMSGHGVHSRRASDRETMRRTLDTFIVSDQDEFDSSQSIGPQDINQPNHLSSATRTTSFWQNLVVVRIGETSCERGGWDVACGNRIVGIRRKPRPLLTRRREVPHAKLRPLPSMGLTLQDLERWELWMFNPPDARLEASPIIALDDRTSSVLSRYKLGASSNRPVTARRPSVGEAIPRLHFTRVSPVVGGESCCVAGFGNTVGVFNFGDHATRSTWQTTTERLRNSLDRS
ncbi:hypothetical protein K474DRAFT_1687913 [Panus rudis PR-1116 ss-1]|nr:hypothetical protein K474DRAFT_1687913 [Panus rudis PR-1116 ss-1]